MGRRRNVAQSLALVPRATQRPSENSMASMLRRRHVCPGEKRGPAVGKTKRGKGTKIMVLADGRGTPLGISLASASPSEISLFEQTLAAVPCRQLHGRPKAIIADKAYDSNALRQRLAHRNILPIIPARKNNRRATHQDGRHLRRYRHRWMIERTNAWLHNFRRVTIRYERKLENYAAFVHLACAMITLRAVLG